jgi:hypothetical protein
MALAKTMKLKEYGTDILSHSEKSESFISTKKRINKTFVSSDILAEPERAE